MDGGHDRIADGETGGASRQNLKTEEGDQRGDAPTEPGDAVWSPHNEGVNAGGGDQLAEKEFPPDGSRIPNLLRRIHAGPEICAEAQIGIFEGGAGDGQGFQRGYSRSTLQFPPPQDLS